MTVRRLLIIDCETTGLSPVMDSVIEVAVILYDVEHATVRSAYSSLLRCHHNPAEPINRISPAAIVNADDGTATWRFVESIAGNAQAIVAHNAEFDRAFVPPSLRTCLPWICSKDDIRWPKQTREGASLVSLALEHDLGVAVVHRAMADCDLIARLFTRARELGADLDAMLVRAMRPKGEFVALVSYDDRDKAKAAGFRWDAETKQWWRRMAIEDAAVLPFHTAPALPRVAVVPNKGGWT